MFLLSLIDEKLINFLKISAILLISVCYGQALSQSFDCKNAKEYVEKMICGKENLQKYDEQLNNLYKITQQSEKDVNGFGLRNIAGKDGFKVILERGEEQKTKIKKSQQAWIQRRNKCQTATCVEEQYLERINFLVSQEDDQDKKNRNILSKFESLTEATQINIKEIDPKFIQEKLKALDSLDYDFYGGAVRVQNASMLVSSYQINGIMLDRFDLTFEHSRYGGFNVIILACGGKYFTFITPVSYADDVKIFNIKNDIYLTYVDAITNVGLNKHVNFVDISGLKNVSPNGEIDKKIIVSLKLMPNFYTPGNSWYVKSKKIKSTCIEIEWSSSDNFKLYSKRLNTFDEGWPGKHWGKEFWAEKFNDYGEPYSLFSQVDKCLNPKVGDWFSDKENDEIVVYGVWDAAQCMKFAPFSNGACKSMALIGVVTDPTYLVRSSAGLYGYFEINGLDYIAPLKFGELAKLVDEL